MHWKNSKACGLEILSNPHFDTYEAQYQAILNRIDPTSSTELEFLDYLYQGCFRLPDDAQRSVPGLFVKPDFFYDPDVWIFCDGTPHDNPDIRRIDQAKRQEIMNSGQQVVVYYYQDDLGALIASRPDIFHKVK